MASKLTSSIVTLMTTWTTSSVSWYMEKKKTKIETFLFNTLTVTQLAVGMENKVQMKLKHRKKIIAEKMAVISISCPT